MRKASRSVIILYCNAEAAGFEPANRLRAVNCFRGSLLQPLGHASCYFIGTLSQTLTLRAAFASSTYLLSQIPGPGRSSDDDLLNSPRPPFQGGDQGLRAFHRRLPSLLASSGPASDDALLFYWDSVPNPDTPCGLYVLHIFAVANTRTRSVV